MRELKKKRKRAIEDIEDPLPNELYSQLILMKEPYRSCSAFLYLTGNRVSEVLGMPLYERKRSETDEWIVKPLRVNQIEFVEGKPIMRARIHTLKREGRPTHTYTVRIDLEEEKRYFELIKDYLSTKTPLDFAWNFSRYKLWRYLNKATTIPPHKLRGLRATRDAVEFELDAIDLKQKFNWASPNMAFHYASKSSHDIENKLMQKKL